MKWKDHPPETWLHDVYMSCLSAACVNLPPRWFGAQVEEGLSRRKVPAVHVCLFCWRDAGAVTPGHNLPTSLLTSGGFYLHFLDRTQGIWTGTC